MRLLARLAGPDVPAPAETPFAERLGQWLHWTDAAALSNALDGPDTLVPASGAASVQALADTLARIRETLARHIAADCAEARAASEDSPDFAPWRRRLLHHQHMLGNALAPLRERLRAALAEQGADTARLAEIDAVMERTLGAQERALLGTTLPSLLQRHFERLRKDTPDTWRDPFCATLHELLMAELDLRLQPLEGLLATMRSRPAPVPST